MVWIHRRERFGSACRSGKATAKQQAEAYPFAEGQFEGKDLPCGS